MPQKTLQAQMIDPKDPNDLIKLPQKLIWAETPKWIKRQINAVVR